MHRTFGTLLTYGLLAILFLSLAQPSNAISQSLCSSQNTGSDSDSKYDTYQSNGACQSTCNDYAFAIVQGNDCWCSNYAPADTTSVSDCSTSCPGYPDDKCGNTDKKLFGYIALSNKPSGTQGGSQPSSTVSSAPSSSDIPSTSDLPSSKPTETAQSAKPTDSAAQTTLQTSTTKQPSSSLAATPITSVQTLTVSGIVVTQTVTSFPTDSSASGQNEKQNASPGVIAGAVVGGVGGLALVGLLVFLLLRRRKQHNNGQEPENPSASPPRRNTSTMSRTGLLHSSEKEPLPAVVTTNSRNSRHLDPESISPVSSERRNSRPLFYDQRLNPTALMDLDNGSHSSLVTIEDNRDYTRTLNVRNPDPEPDPHAH